MHKWVYPLLKCLLSCLRIKLLLYETGEAQWSLCVTCGAWLALQGFDHLTFKFNREILLTVVLPSLKGIAEFFIGKLYF